MSTLLCNDTKTSVANSLLRGINTSRPGNWLQSKSCNSDRIIRAVGSLVMSIPSLASSSLSRMASFEPRLNRIDKSGTLISIEAKTSLLDLLGMRYNGRSIESERCDQGPCNPAFHKQPLIMVASHRYMQATRSTLA